MQRKGGEPPRALHFPPGWAVQATGHSTADACTAIFPAFVEIQAVGDQKNCGRSRRRHMSLFCDPFDSNFPERKVTLLRGLAFQIEGKNV